MKQLLIILVLVAACSPHTYAQKEPKAYKQPDGCCKILQTIIDDSEVHAFLTLRSFLNVSFVNETVAHFGCTTVTTHGKTFNIVDTSFRLAHRLRILSIDEIDSTYNIAIDYEPEEKFALIKLIKKDNKFVILERGFANRLD